MKHFFFEYNPDSHSTGILNSLFVEHDLLNNPDEKMLKVYYDAADTIYDKRLEQEDEELKKFVEGTDDNYHFLSQYNSITSDGKYYRIIALKMLWSYVEQQYQIFEEQNGRNADLINEISTKRTLYHLVRGNICQRISQCYYENFDLKNSDIWGNKAIEILWHGKNLAARLRDFSPEKEKTQTDLYLRLIKLNLAKYYRDYARKNRRSDFDAALDEFRHVRQRVEEQIGEAGNREEKRQYTLLWMDAIFNIINIYRRKYQVDVANRGMAFFYDCLQKKFENPKTNNFSSLIKKANTLTAYEDTGTPSDIEEISPELNTESFDKCDALNDYDKERYLLLALLELSRIRRNLHFVKNYSNSIAIAIIADEWSYKMDTSGHNMDALITISSSLRKYIKFQNEIIPEKQDSKGIQTITDNAEFKLYLRSNAGKKEKETATLLSFVQKLKDFAQKGHLKSKTEVIKWHCLYQQNQKLLKCIQNEVGEYDHIKNFLEEGNPNLQLRFLKGLVYLRSKKYTDAIQIFEELIFPDNKETNYIRLGTIGLKARYLLANCYMSLSEYSKAEKILKSLQSTLVFAKKSRQVQGVSGNTDAETDARIEIDLGYCYMQRGEYNSAIKIYEEMYGEGEITKSTLTFRAPQVRRELLIMGMNNYAACCILSVNDQKTKKSIPIKKQIETARKIFLYMDTYFFHDTKKSDSETNLLKGFYTLCIGTVPAEEPITDEQVDICQTITTPERLHIREKSIISAHKYFREACRFHEAFSPQYSLLNEQGAGNMAIYRDEVERISVYIINLTKLYKIYLKNKDLIEQNRTDFLKKNRGENSEISLTENLKVTEPQLEYLMTSKRNLERFLLSFPITYKISLKAAIALAEWLLEHDKNTTPKKAQQAEYFKSKRLLDQMYRSFSYITIYEERGARVFNILKDNIQFRFFTSAQRGKFLALLLAMYKPIKAIKEECCFNIEDMHHTKNLVHYTSIETLKNILTEKTAAECNLNPDCTKKAPEPRFRINNCGYMNDVFEGNTFLDGIALVASDNGHADKDSSPSDFIKKYFPQLNRSHENMLPSGSNVYIGSLSVKKDSFPMWSVYASNESGCNIEFGNGFFDIDGVPYHPNALRDYMLSKYTDQDYPIYIVQYIGSRFKANFESYKETVKNNEWPKDDFEIADAIRHPQDCGTNAIKYPGLFRLFEQIYKRWKQLDDYLKEICNQNIARDSKNIIHAFAADRINEIRFLFKNSDYEFEGEVRVVYTDSTDNSISKIDAALNVPRVYVDMDRKLEGMTVRLGSRIEDATVDKYVTWLKHTKRVQRVELAKRNRYTSQKTRNEPPLSGNKLPSH